MNTADRPSPAFAGAQAAQLCAEPLEGLCCPHCHGSLKQEGTRLVCEHCARTAVLQGGCLIDFLDGPGVAAAILGWPGTFVEQVEAWLLAVAERKPLSAAARAELEVRQLLAEPGPDARLTPLGGNLAYHAAEFAVQSTRERGGGFLEQLTEHTGLGRAAKVLDVGCGAGQTLRLLGGLQPAERVGLDIDAEALAFGCRLAERDGEAIRLIHGSAYQLPFCDGRFSHVLCRVALNYVQQRSVLREMARVLQPGGYLACTVEGIGYDLQLLRQARHPMQFLFRLRELGHGLVHAVSGVQAAPGKRWTGGRAFATVGRCVGVLAQAGCELIHAVTTSRYLGLPMGISWVARKREGGTDPG